MGLCRLPSVVSKLRHLRKEAFADYLQLEAWPWQKFDFSFQGLQTKGREKVNELWAFFVNTVVAILATQFWMIVTLCLVLSGMLAYATWLRGQLKAYTIVEDHQQNNQAAPQDLCQHLLVQPMRDFFSRMKTRVLKVTCCCSCSCNRCQTADPEIPQAIPLQDLAPNRPPAPLGPVIAPLDWPPTSQATPDPPTGLPMIVPALDPCMMIPAPDSSVMVPIPGPQLTSVSVTMPPQHYQTLPRNNSFRRNKDDQQIQSWMNETAKLLAKIQNLNAASRRDSLPAAASHDSLYENTHEDNSLSFGFTDGTGWQYRPAPPRPSNRNTTERSLVQAPPSPSPPPLPPPPVRTSSLRLKGVAKALASSKKGEQQ